MDVLPVLPVAGDAAAAAAPEMEGEDGGDKVYVAVGSDRSKSLPTLRWALRHAPAGKTLMVLLYVHRPAKMIPIFTGANVPASVLRDEIVSSYRQQERSVVEMALREYLDICSSEKVLAEALTVESDNTAHALVELISEHKISTLIMGAGRYGRAGTETDQRTKLAITVEEQADPSCKILFVHKGNLFSSRPRRTNLCMTVNNDIPTMEGSHLPCGSWHAPTCHLEKCGDADAASSSFPSDSQSMTDSMLDPERLDHPFMENSLQMFDCDSFSLISHDSLSGLNEIASQVILSGHSQDLRQVPFDVRCDEARRCQFIYGIDSILGVNCINLEEIHWKFYMEDKTIKWIYVLEYIRKVLTVALKQLQEQQGGLTLEGLSEAAKEPIHRLLRFALTVSKVNGSPEKLFHMLRMHKALTEASPMILEALLGDMKESFIRDLQQVLSMLEDAAREILGKLKFQIQSYGSTKMSERIQLVTEYLMRYITLLAHQISTLDTILGHGHSDHLLADECINSSGRLISGLISDLCSMLQKQSKLYMPEGLQYLFLMNNEHFMLQQIEHADVKWILGTELIQKYCHNVKQYEMSYMEATWATVVSCLEKRTSGSLKFLHPSPLKEFQSSFETTCNVQMHWKVPDPQLRVELRQTVCQYVVQAYRAFMEKHPNLEKDRVYCVEKLEIQIGELFEG